MNEGSESVTFCNRLKFEAADGKEGGSGDKLSPVENRIRRLL